MWQLGPVLVASLCQMEVQTLQRDSRALHQHEKSVQNLAELLSCLDYEADGVPALGSWAEDDARSLCDDVPKLL